MNKSDPVPASQKRRGMPIWLIVLLTFCLLLVVGLPVCGVVGIYGARKYIAQAKSDEARKTLAEIAKHAAVAYEKTGRLCPSTNHPVPSNAALVSGTKYQSTAADWRESGFACLGFSLDAPQYYQYSYEAKSDGFEATARGDLNGDGAFSTFAVHGAVSGGRLEIQPVLDETNPLE